MGGPGERAEQPAPEVDRIELGLGGGVTPGKRGDERTQDGALARAGRSHDRQVASRAREVQLKRIRALLGRAIDRPEWHAEALPARLRLPERPAFEDRVERLGGRQRRQPDLMHGRGLAVCDDEAVDDDLELGAALLAAHDRRGRVRGAPSGAAGGVEGAHLSRSIDRRLGGLAVRGRGERGAELNIGGGIDLQVAEPRQEGQQVGVRGVEDHLGLRCRVGPQAHPVAQVALEAAQAALIQPLRREQHSSARSRHSF